MILRCLVIVGLLGLAACVETPTRSVVAVPDDIPRFPIRAQPSGVARSNIDLAEDFIDLTFQLENGDRLTRLLKYEGPVRVMLHSPGLRTYQPEISGLLSRLRSETGIDIAETRDPALAQIHVHAIPRSAISRAFPGAACFIVPGYGNGTSSGARPVAGRQFSGRTFSA